MRRVGGSLAALAVLQALVGNTGTASAKPDPLLIARAGHVSGIARPEARLSARGATRPSDTCTTSDRQKNFRADCASTGRPVNETWMAAVGSSYVAGANDYNSYNGNSDFGYYTSGNAKAWTDNGPLDLFPEGPDHAAGDPGVAIDVNGVVYFSGIYFDYSDCSVGGNELARYDPGSGTWSYYQINDNSDSAFQDKPAVAVDDRHVFESWTRYDSCTGGGFSPIKVAAFSAGPTSVPPAAILKVPGSVYSQGSALATDGQGGFWITWEEYPSPTATIGAIWLAHWRGFHPGWDTPQKISPDGFKDLPSPLPGFGFRTDSFPAITLTDGQPNVVWCSNDTGVGRAYWWLDGTSFIVSDSGGDQFFPSAATQSDGQIAISWSQTDQPTQTYDQYLSVGGVAQKVSTKSSHPFDDQFFFGSFIGDYSGMAVVTTEPHPIWTDIRRADPQFGGKAEDAVVFAS